MVHFSIKIVMQNEFKGSLKYDSYKKHNGKHKHHNLTYFANFWLAIEISHFHSILPKNFKILQVQVIIT